MMPPSAHKYPQQDRRSDYIKLIPTENELLSFSKKCLANEPQEIRPEKSKLEP